MARRVTIWNAAFHVCDQCTQFCLYVIFMYLQLGARTPHVTVKTFYTRVPILQHAIDLVAAAIAASTGEIPCAGDISNAFVKQPGLHSRVSLHNEYRVTGHLKSRVRFEMCSETSIVKNLITVFKTVYCIAERISIQK